MSGWYGEKLYLFGIEMLNLVFVRGQDGGGDILLVVQFVGCYSVWFLLIGINFLFVIIFCQWEYINSSLLFNNNSGIMCISLVLLL